MNIIFLSLMFNESSLSDAHKYSKCGVQMATHVFQNNIVRGILDAGDVDISVINLPPVGSYPLNYRKALIRTKKWENNIEIGCLNFPKIKHIQQQHRIEKEIINRLKSNEKNVILIYSLYLPFMQAAVQVKKKYPNVKLCLLQTDCVDGRNGMEKYMTKSAIRRGDKQVSLAKDVNGFILLSKYLTEPLEVENRPHMIMECICNSNQEVSETNDELRSVCLYTGTLDSCYGIVELIDAFSTLSKGELWICGDGDAKELVLKRAAENERIKYLGFVNQKQLKELRNKCDYLINPRRPDGTYTLYSFPSKTAEYMMTGKPTIMYKLEGIPDEYDEYLIYLSGAESKTIASELEKIFDEEYEAHRQTALKGREFMVQNKNEYVQGNRMVRFMQELF